MGNHVFLIFSIQYLLISFDFYSSTTNATPWMGKSVQPAGKKEFPFVVSFSRKMHFGRGVNHFCAGSLISKVHVLSVAHCFAKEKNLTNIVANIGSNKIGSGDRYELKSWMTYNNWAEKDKIICAYCINDLIVITLDEEVKGIEPGVISFAKDKDNFGKKAVGVGWGVGNDGKVQEYLKKVYLKVLSMDEAVRELHNVYNETLELSLTYLYTIGHDKNHTLVVMGGGDSGGPLIDVNTNEIIGVNESSCSKTETSHLCAVNLHASVDYYRHFIKRYIPSCSDKMRQQNIQSYT